jgi:hypothetical protein
MRHRFLASRGPIATCPLVTALTTVTLRGPLPVVLKVRRPIDRWQVAELENAAWAEARWFTDLEAHWLATARHPGVVRLRRVWTEQATLETELGGPATLRTAVLTPGAILGTLAAVATTLAAVHQRGLVHANVAPEHVIVDPARPDEPLLCSPAPWASETGHHPEPGDDLDGLVAMADALGPRPRDGFVSPVRSREQAWQHLVAQLADCHDATDAARILGRALPTGRRWRPPARRRWQP